MLRLLLCCTTTLICYYSSLLQEKNSGVVTAAQYVRVHATEWPVVEWKLREEPGPIDLVKGCNNAYIVLEKKSHLDQQGYWLHAPKTAGSILESSWFLRPRPPTDNKNLSKTQIGSAVRMGNGKSSTAAQHHQYGSCENVTTLSNSTSSISIICNQFNKRCLRLGWWGSGASKTT